MQNKKEQANLFFDQYAQRFNKALKEESAGIEETANAFAECFVEASPRGILCGKNDEQFRSALPKGYDFYKSIGMQSMVILAKDITVLDAFHVMVKVHWKTIFKTERSNGEIEFDVIYFLQEREQRYRIFAYITGDEQKTLHEKGLI